MLLCKVAKLHHYKAQVLAITLFLCTSYLSAEPAGIPELPQFKIISLTNISADQGAEFLAEAKIGTVSKFPDSNALLITAEAGELSKATAILTLVDVKEQFAVRMITPSLGLDKLPSNEQIAKEVGSISIGTFSSLPSDTSAARAIVDIHNDALVVVAPQKLIERIIAVIEGRPAPKINHVEAGREPTLPESEPSLHELESPVPEPAVAAQRYAPEPMQNGDEVLKLNLPEKLDISDLLGLAGEYLGLDFMYDQTQVRGEVTLKLQGKYRGDLQVKDLYPLLESALKFRNFGMTRKGNLVTIVPVADVPEIDPILISEEQGQVETGDVVVTRVFQLEYIDATNAQNFLTAMRLATTITPIPDTGTLVVTGYAYRMPRIEELLNIIDRPGKPKDYRFRELKFTMANTLATKVKALAEQIGTVSISVTAPAQPTTPVRGRRGPMPVPTQPSPTPSRPTVYLDADERTNRILMIGYPEELEVVEQLIDSLDVEQQDLRTLKIHKIVHVDAEEARKKLSEIGIIGADGRASGSSRITGRAVAGGPPAPEAPAGEIAGGLLEGPQVVVIEMTNSLLINATAEQHVRIEKILQYVDSLPEEEEIPYKVYPLENQSPEDLGTILNQLIQETIRDQEGKIQSVVQKTEEEIIIIPDESTFSLIVYASKKNQDWIVSLIKQLDRRRPQVLIDVTLVEISEADAFDYDLQLVSKFPELEPGQTMAKLATDATTALLSPFPSKQITEATSILGDTSSGKGFYADRHIQALLNLMQKKGYGRVLARPKILVNDNEQGHIDTTKTIYVSRSSQSVTPTGEPVVSTSYTFDEFPSGIGLDIKPHISEGNLLRLEIGMMRSSQTAPEGGIQANEPPPNKSENTITTVVTVPDNSTIILGGITTLEQAKNNWKIPLLGDVPVVGGIFRKIDNTSRQNRLYVFVRANILRPAENLAGLPDLERISGINRSAFEKFEEKFQKYQDWPGIKSKPMDPLKVLEAE
jgi:type II secretory pathway component GspD/PulD (secretin)